MPQDQAQSLLNRSTKLISREDVSSALQAMAAKLDEQFSGSSPIFLTIMNGGMIPGARLASMLKLPVRMDYVHATRYRSGTHGGELNFRVRPHLAVKDEDVIIFDDIFDEGHTLQAMRDYCLEQGARRVLTVVLVRKQHDRGLPRDTVDLVGLDVPDVYVFGCGMDVHEFWRQLDEIWALGDD